MIRFNKARLGLLATALSTVGTSAFAQNTQLPPGREGQPGTTTSEAGRAFPGRREINNTNVGTRMRGSVVRVSEPDGMVVVQSADGKQMSFYSDKRSKYRLNSRDATIANLQTGSNVDIQYETRNGRTMIHTISLPGQDDAMDQSGKTTSQTSRYLEPREVNGQTRLHGRITQISSNPNQFVFRGDGGKETVVLLDDSRDMELTVENRNGRMYLSRVSVWDTTNGNRVDSAMPATTTGTAVTGTIVRVMGRENQFVLRTQSGEEIVMYGDPRATIRIDNQSVPFGSIQEGTQATVVYDSRGKKKILRSFEATGRRRVR